MTKQSMKRVCDYINDCASDKRLESIEIHTKSGAILLGDHYSFTIYTENGDDLDDEIALYRGKCIEYISIDSIERINVFTID